MLFEEFLKKKKISLEAFKQAEAGLFYEFESHYAQMGEKSFDHTKKYWFNKLRRRYPLPPEIKADKVRMENPIAEQTVTETLTEPTDVQKLGFRPKFKTAASTRSVEDTTGKPKEEPAPSPQENQPEEQKGETPKPAPVGFKPRFKAAAPPKTLQEKPEPEQPAEKPETPVLPKTDEPAKPAALGFKPRFKTAAAQPKTSEEKSPEQTSDASKETPSPIADASETTAKPATLGFKPRFKGIAKPAEQPEVPEKPDVPKTPEPSTDDKVEEKDAKPAYNPRFNMKNIKPKPPEE